MCYVFWELILVNFLVVFSLFFDGFMPFSIKKESF